MSANSYIFNPTETTSAAQGEGFSAPRLTTAARLAINFTTLDKGMMVYDTTLNSLFIWNGTAWELIDGTGTSSNTQVLFNDNGATAGDSTMTFDKTTDTLTIQNLVVTGTTTALGGLDASSIRAAASDYAAVNFDGATSGTRIVSACQALGTGDFSLWSRFRVPTSFAAFPGITWLTPNSTTSNQPNALGIYLDPASAGVLRVFRHGAISGTDTRAATVAGFLTNFVGQVVDVVVTRAGNTLKIYINGTDTAYTETTTGAAPPWSQTVDSGFSLVGSAGTTSVFTGRIYRSVVFNRALSASDVTELITLGVNPADQWGSQTAVYTSDFSAGTDGWGQVRSTVVGNIDGISGVDNTLRVTVDSTATITHYAFNTTVPGLLVGKRYRVGFNYFITAANATMNGLRLQQLTTSQNITPIQSVTGAWTSITPVEFVSTETRLDVLGYAGANSSFTGNGTDTFYLHSFVLTRIGAIVDLDFTIGTGYQATDRSSNNLHGTLFNGVSWTMPETSARLYATTAFLGNSQMLGTLAIPTNAMIEDIFVNCNAPLTLFVGNASGDSSIVGSTAIPGGYNRLPLSAYGSLSGNLWVNCNSSSALQFTIIYSIARP